MISNNGKRIVLIGGGHVNCQVLKVRKQQPKIFLFLGGISLGCFILTPLEHLINLPKYSKTGLVTMQDFLLSRIYPNSGYFSEMVKILEFSFLAISYYSLKGWGRTKLHIQLTPESPLIVSSHTNNFRSFKELKYISLILEHRC